MFIYLSVLTVINSANEVTECFNFSESTLKCFENFIKNVTESSEELSEEFDKLINNNIIINNYLKDTDNANQSNSTTNVIARKIRKKMTDFLPILITPAFVLAGIMPWIMPKLKLAVFTIGLINNFVFFQALFSLVRNYVFNTAKNEHIIYLNNGYKKKETHLYHPPYYDHHRSKV